MYCREDRAISQDSDEEAIWQNKAGRLWGLHRLSTSRQKKTFAVYLVAGSGEDIPVAMNFTYSLTPISRIFEP